MMPPSTMLQPVDLVTAAAIAGAGAAAAWRLRWLTVDGMVAAWVVGAAVLGFGDWRWAVVLGMFVVSGTALTRIGRERKTQPEHAGTGRTAAQVLCTGGAGAALALLWGVLPHTAGSRPLFYAAFLGSLSAATADTWATEIGMLSRTPPRSIITRRPVPTGTSGGVSWLGSVSGATGAGVVAAAGAWGDAALFTAVTAAGALAMILDSILGATVQVSYRHPDGTVGETPRAGSVPIRGIGWITNPVVNLAATLSGAIVAAALAR